LAFGPKGQSNPDRELAPAETSGLGKRSGYVPPDSPWEKELVSSIAQETKIKRAQWLRCA